MAKPTVEEAQKELKFREKQSQSGMAYSSCCFFIK
jgi:hypothetical protein